MNLVLDQFTRTISGTKVQERIPVVGSAVRCTSATVDFQISFDGSPFVPFGQARELRPTTRDGSPYQFDHIDIKIADGDGTANTVVLVVGDCNYADSRVQLYPNQTIRETPATRMQTNNYTSVSAVAPQPLGGLGSGAEKMINVRNTHATQTALIGTDTTPGYILGPGENVDLPVSAALYAISPVGTTLTVTQFFY